MSNDGVFFLLFWVFSVLVAFLVGLHRGLKPGTRTNRRQQIRSQIETLQKEYEGLGDGR